MKKSKVPQIYEKTGISFDYNNAFMGLIIDLKHYSEEKRKYFPVKKYTEHFNRYSIVYEDLITDKNRDTIKKLDTIVDCINRLLLLEKKNDEELLRLYSEVHKIIYG